MGLETIVTRQPDALLLIERIEHYAWGIEGTSWLGTLEKAVREGRVYYTDERIQYPGPNRIRCIGGLSETISSLSLIHKLVIACDLGLLEQKRNGRVFGKRGENPPLPRNCNRRETGQAGDCSHWGLNP